MTWTSARTIAKIAYRDWLSNPTTEKKIFPKSIRIKWYKTMESTPSKINIEGPHTKFCVNHNWDDHINAKKMGASAVVGRGMKKISFDKNFTKSTAI